MVGNNYSVTRRLFLSVVVPVRDEADVLPEVLASAAKVLTAAAVPFELLVVDDHSTDRTAEEALKAPAGAGTIRCVRNEMEPGIAQAIEIGIRQARGDITAIMMGDGSDRPSDLARYYQVIEGGVDCAFGSRFIARSSVEGYPPLKFILNRLGNWLVALVFGHRYNDFTNAFKAYRTLLLTEMLPLRSRGFEVTLEMPIRAILSGGTFQVLPISWRNRSSGQSKMKPLWDVWRYLHRLFLLRIRVDSWGFRPGP